MSRPPSVDAAMERYAAGEESAFGELYDHVASRLYGYLVRRTGDPQLAEDLLQQTLLQVHRARSSFIPGAKVMPWLHTIARRLVIDHARSARRQAVLTSVGEAESVAAKTPGAEEVIQAQQLMSQIEDELKRLPEPQQVAFELLKRQELSLTEAAEILEITVGALKLRMHRVHGALRAALATTEELPDSSSAELTVECGRFRFSSHAVEGRR